MLETARVQREALGRDVAELRQRVIGLESRVDQIQRRPPQ
jgi:hypothetical protein